MTEAFRHQASLGWVWLAACTHTLLPSVGALAVQFQLYSKSENLRTDLGPPLRKVPEPLQHPPPPALAVPNHSGACFPIASFSLPVTGV